MTSPAAHPSPGPSTSDFKPSDKHQGSCSIVSLSNDHRTILKRPIQHHDSHLVTDAHERAAESLAYMEREKAIYKHLGPHPGILQVLEIREDGILFPYLRKGPLRAHLRSSDQVSRAQREAWIETATRSLVFVHSRDVLVGDISTRNFLIADDNSIVLSDFSGSGLCGLESMIEPETRYEKVDASSQPVPISLHTEIFALGSLIYEIATSREPHGELDEEEVRAMFARKAFPSTAEIMYGDVVKHCWEGQFVSSSEVLNAIAEYNATTAEIPMVAV